MDKTGDDLLNALALAGAEQLDLTPTQYAGAVAHYEAVGKYLAEQGSLLERYSPVVFAQGSIAIGTATKPVGRDKFDVDLICQLSIPPCVNLADVNPADVKRIVGERLKAHDTYKRMLREKNRCWRLVYAGDFHMDIIPGILDPRGRTGTALLVPDKKLHCWKETDPKAYANWFLDRAKVATGANEAVHAEVEPAPSAERRKLALQVVVQLLKRHRDLMFVDDEDAPISIIITTLAARAYNGSKSIVDALSGALMRMPDYIERKATGVAHVGNPLNPLENFADKWSTHPHRKQCFFAWLAKARGDFERLRTAVLPNMQDTLGNWVGERAAKRAIEDYAQDMRRRCDTGVGVSAATGMLGSTSPRAAQSPNHTFFGR